MNNKIDKNHKFLLANQVDAETKEIRNKRHQGLLDADKVDSDKKNLRKEIELQMQRKYSNKADIKSKHVLLDKNYCRKLDLLKSETGISIKDLLRSMVEEKIDQELKKLTKINPALAELLKALS